MSNQEPDFFNNIDELIALFKKLQKKAKEDGVLQEGDPMYKNFELLAENYSMIKGSIPPEMMGDIADPIKKIVNEMVQQLKNDLGIKDDDDDLKAKSADKEEEKEYVSELSKIDALLKNGNLSESEINDLLDKRANLSE